MNTSSFLIEYIIGGFQSLIWIAILFGTFLGIDFIHSNYTQLIDTPFIIATMIPFIYPLGIIIDNISHSIFQIFSKNLYKKYWVRKNKNYDVKLFLKFDPLSLTNELEKIQTSIKIMRISVINLSLILLSILVFSTTVTLFKSILALIIFVEIYLITLGVFCLVWVKIQKYYLNLSKELN